MSQKESKINSPITISEYQTATSSSNYPINQSMISSNSKEFKNQAIKPQLKCTCSHTKTKLKQQLKCTCKINKKNNTRNTINYKAESRKSRFDKIEKTDKRSANIVSNSSKTSKLVCTCKTDKNNKVHKMSPYTKIKNPLNLWKQNMENLQILSSPAPELTAQYVQNLEIIQKPKPIRILLPIPKNEISFTNKIAIDGLSQIESNEIIDKEVVNKHEIKNVEKKNILNDNYNKPDIYNYTRKIRANIIRLENKEKADKDYSSLSDYDVLQKITKYKEDFKYKSLVNQSLELIQSQSSNSNQKMNIITQTNDRENQEKLSYKNIFLFTSISKQESIDLTNNKQEINEVQFSPTGINNSQDIIQDFTQELEDSPYQEDPNTKEDLEEEDIIYNQKKFEKYQAKNIDINNFDNQDSKLETKYISMKKEESIEENNPIEDSQQNDENELDVESYELDKSTEKNENNEQNIIFHKELELETEEKNELVKNDLMKSNKPLEIKEEQSVDKKNIDEERKINVYNFDDNKDLQGEEKKKSNVVFVCFKSSVKRNKKNKGEKRSPIERYSPSN